MAMADFHVGQRVACVDDEGFNRPAFYGCEIFPVKANIYTIRQISLSPEGEAAFRLFEIVNEPREYLIGCVEPCFLARRFRPLQERKTDISIFEKLLVPNTELEKVATHTV
jgi:hypothetical protein